MWNNYFNPDWSSSILQKLLNSGAYWNRSTELYNNDDVTVDFTTTGLTNEAKSMIGDAVWNLGGYTTNEEVTTSMFYEYERGDRVYLDVPTTWVGEVGLMYPSDFGYATSGGDTMDRVTCLSYPPYNWAPYWSGTDYPDCYNNDWMYDGLDKWTITAWLDRQIPGAFILNSRGFIDKSYLTSNQWTTVFPVVYLSSSIKFVDGDGSESNPFTLSL